MANVARPIHPVLQPPGTHQCWAAVVAMMLDRHGPDNSAIIHQVIRESRQLGVPSTVFGDSLDATNGPQALATAFGFHFVDLRGQPVHDGNYFASFLGAAPFGLMGLRPGYGLHAIAINRLNGDFSSLGTTQAHGIDPAGTASGFSRPLFDLVMPSRTASSDMVGHCVMWR